MKKNGVSCLAIMITPGVMKIKVSENSSFFVFSAYATKKISHSLDKIFTCI